MGWTRNAFASTSAIFAEPEKSLSTLNAALLTAGDNGLSVTQSIRAAILNNRYTSARAYLRKAERIFTHKLPTIVQSSPLRDPDRFTSVAFSGATPIIYAVTYKIPTARELVGQHLSHISNYSYRTNRYVINRGLNKNSTTVTISNIRFIDSTSIQYMETRVNSDNDNVSTPTRTINRAISPSTPAMVYLYAVTEFPGVRVRVYEPKEADAHLYNNLSSSYIDPKDYVAFPIYAILLDDVYIDHSSRSKEYSEAKILLNGINIPIDSLLSTVKKNIPDASDDEDLRVTDVFLMNAINIQSTTQAGMAYLYEYFYSLYLSSTDLSVGTVRWNIPTYGIKITESDYNFHMRFDTISSAIVAGIRTTYGRVITPEGVVTFQEPSSPGTSVHRVVTMTQLSAYTIIDYPSGNIKRVDIALDTDKDSLGYANFCIPLILGVMAKLPTISLREQVFLESFVRVNHSLREFYVKWYVEWQDEILLAAVIAISLWLDGGLSAKAFITKFSIAVGVNAALTALLADIDDPYARLAITLAVTYITLDSGSISIDTFDLSNPEVLINLVSAVGNTYQQVKFDKLQQEDEEVSAENEERTKLLEEVRNGLGTTAAQDLLLNVQLNDVRSYEEPSVFFSRTLNTNPGTLAYEELSKYYDSKKTLPRLDPRKLIS